MGKKVTRQAEELLVYGLYVPVRPDLLRKCGDGTDSYADNSSLCLRPGVVRGYRRTAA